MDKLKQSPAEELKLVKIMPIEQECLDRVFDYLSSEYQGTLFGPAERPCLIMTRLTVDFSLKGPPCIHEEDRTREPYEGVDIPWTQAL
jgi:hypothetical protein